MPNWWGNKPVWTGATTSRMRPTVFSGLQAQNWGGLKGQLLEGGYKDLQQGPPSNVQTKDLQNSSQDNEMNKTQNKILEKLAWNMPYKT